MLYLKYQNYLKTFRYFKYEDWFNNYNKSIHYKDKFNKNYMTQLGYICDKPYINKLNLTRFS